MPTVQRQSWRFAKQAAGRDHPSQEIGDTPYGARLFEVEVSGLRIGFLTYAKKADDSRRTGRFAECRGQALRHRGEPL